MMSVRQAAEPLDDFEPEVAAYLKANPHFFEAHPDLLTALHFSHETGSAVSLVERQVRTLREQNEEYRHRIADLIRVAQQNEGVEQRLHRLTMSLLDGLAAPADPIALQQRLGEEFQVERVELRLFPDNDPGELRELTDATEPRCGRLGAGHLRLLFGAEAQNIRSSALVPLKGGRFCGLLAFGSRDEHRFQPGLGTDYLARLGELVTKALEVAPLLA